MRKMSAFTLVELLVVIGIISMLAALMLPTLQEALEQGRRIACLNNQKQVYVGAACYASEFNDFLPSGSYTAGGTNIVFSQLGFYSTRTFAASYLGIPLAKYTYAPAHLGGPTWVPATDADLRTHNSTNIQFFTQGTALQRGVLGCPGARNTNAVFLDYWLVGFGGGYCYNNSPFTEPYTAGGREKYYHTRLAKVGASVGGYAKTMLVDNCAPMGTISGGVEYGAFTGHKPLAPEGVNSVTGDGAGRWSSETFTPGGWTGKKMLPTGYYAINYICMWYPGDPNDPILCFTNHAKTRSVYRLTTAGQETNFNKWLREWY